MQRRRIRLNLQRLLHFRTLHSSRVALFHLSGTSELWDWWIDNIRQSDNCHLDRSKILRCMKEDKLWDLHRPARCSTAFAKFLILLIFKSLAKISWWHYACLCFCTFRRADGRVELGMGSYTVRPTCSIYTFHAKPEITGSWNLHCAESKTLLEAPKNHGLFWQAWKALQHRNAPEKCEPGTLNRKSSCNMFRLF